MSSERRAALGLGGNVGDPARAMAEALRMLDARADCRVVAVSRLYRTPPWGKTDQDWFFNACALVDTKLDPEPLLDVCLGIEKEMKRERKERWGPRTIDIDVLAYEGVAQAGGRLELPHPRMIARGFVLMPLSDIAPEMEIFGRSVRDWLPEADVAGIEPTSAGPDWWRETT